MGLLKEDLFICLDCETTGLDSQNDRIIEVAVTLFNFSGIIESWESLIDPKIDIPSSSTAIHHIDSSMVAGQPPIENVLPHIFKFIKKYPIVGHSILTDLLFLENSAKRASISWSAKDAIQIDTLRLARMYGGTPTNSLEALRQHFNIPVVMAHRAMSDVHVNIQVFKQLAGKAFKKTEELLKRLELPILLKTMPLGKYKSRRFADIPDPYLRWAANQEFDIDLKASLAAELKKRKSGNCFAQASNPFSKFR